MMHIISSSFQLVHASADGVWSPSPLTTLEIIFHWPPPKLLNQPSVIAFKSISFSKQVLFVFLVVLGGADFF